MVTSTVGHGGRGEGRVDSGDVFMPKKKKKTGWGKKKNTSGSASKRAMAEGERPREPGH